MIALVMQGGTSALGSYLVMLTIVPVLLVMAPQEVRRDKRVVIGLIVLALIAVGAPAYAVANTVCETGFLPWIFKIECWFS